MIRWSPSSRCRNHKSLFTSSKLCSSTCLPFQFPCLVQLFMVWVVRGVRRVRRWEGKEISNYIRSSRDHSALSQSLSVPHTHWPWQRPSGTLQGISLLSSTFHFHVIFYVSMLFFHFNFVIYHLTSILRWCPLQYSCQYGTQYSA